MREEQITVRWYTIDELHEQFPDVYADALGKLDSALWSDDVHRDQVADSIRYEFGRAVGEPTVERYGEGDYPGVPDTRLRWWAVLERGEHAVFDGQLTRETAPALPWHDWIESVRLDAGRYYTSVQVEESEDAPYLGWNKPVPELDKVIETMREAVHEAMRRALDAGTKTAEHLSSEEYLVEYARDNGLEFDEHGRT